jgi:predicted ArsR family transcriptional regulator
VIEVLQGSDSPVVTVKEVGEKLGYTSEAARQKLFALRDQGIVERRQVGAGAVVW